MLVVAASCYFCRSPHTAALVATADQLARLLASWLAGSGRAVGVYDIDVPLQLLSPALFRPSADLWSLGEKTIWLLLQTSDLASYPSWRRRCRLQFQVADD